MDNIPEDTKVILLDIFGTTTPVSFIHTTLADFARDHLYEFLERFRSIPEIKKTLADLKRMHSEDVRNGRGPPPWKSEDSQSDLKCILDYCKWLIGHGSDAVPLKSLENYVWEEGYKSGMLRGEVFSEVPGVLSQWNDSGLQVCTYSSGSVFSQQMIFGSTKYGDLMPLIRGHFDTSVGSKNDPQSYGRIAAILRVKPHEILFYSSSWEEIVAARKAGLKVFLMIRDHSRMRLEGDVKAISDLSGSETEQI